MAGSKGKERAADDGVASHHEAVDVMMRLFPVTYPFPDPSLDDDLIPSADVGLEQDLLLNLSNPRSWTAYIEHVKRGNRPAGRDMLFRDADTSLSSAQVDLLGPLAAGSNRLALRRLTFAFERAIAVFPTSYTLWKDYLLHRMLYVLGDPSGGLDGFWKRQIRMGKEKLDVGPTLLDGRGDDEDEREWGRARDGLTPLDGIVGYKEWSSLAATFERSLMYLPNLPRIWLLYFSVLMHPSCPPTLAYTHTRRTFDRALRTLPPSLHLRIWKCYLQWAQARSSETCLRVWRRYLSVDPSLTERYVRLLEQMAEGADESSDEEEADGGEAQTRRARALEAAKLLLKLAKDSIDGKYVSPDGKSSYQLLVEWLELCEKYADDVGLDNEEEQAIRSSDDASIWRSLLEYASPDAIPVSYIVRTLGLQHFPDQAGRLWTGLATFWIRRGDLDVAKDVFEEGMSAVKTVRDFTQIFDAYAETSENVMGFLMDELAELAEDEEDEDDRATKEEEVDRRMREFEELMERRPFLINDVMIRRNPDDVQEWEKRALLHGDDHSQVIATYQKAIDTINPRKSTSDLHQLFTHFAQFYEQQGQLDPARDVLEKATTVPFMRVDDLAEVWCEWAELEIRNGNFDGALRVMARSTEAPNTAAAVKAIAYLDDTLPSQKRLFKSSKLWSFYIDLEESIGTVDSARRTYDRMIELKIATPQVIVNYARFLEEHDYFEDSFRVYERGVEVFTYPIAFELWNIYLAKFIGRYGAGKLERARDLFEQALDKCPDKYCRPLFLMYGKLEEDFGMAKRAMTIYERAAERVPSEDRYNMYLFYIAKVAANMGLAATRPVYERAIGVLPDRQTAEMCVRFAQLERKLGEVDRARALYAHASQFCDPRTEKTFWSQWNAFEIQHGSEQSFREMLRIRRSVQAQFNTDASYIAAYANSQRKPTAAEADATTDEAAAADPMARAEQLAQVQARNGAPVGFVAAKQSAQAVRQDVNGERLGAAGKGDGEGKDDDDDEDLM